MRISDALLQLRQAFDEHEGEVLQITLSKKAADALNAECISFCKHACIGICPACGRKTDNEVLGIKILVTSESISL